MPRHTSCSRATELGVRLNHYQIYKITWAKARQECKVCITIGKYVEKTCYHVSYCNVILILFTGRNSCEIVKHVSLLNVGRQLNLCVQ